MIKVLRKHRNWLMIVIAVLTIPFCLYFVKSDWSNIRANDFVKMYGRKITMTEARRYGSLFQLATFLGITDLTEGLAPGSHGNQQVVTYILNMLVLRHEADRLGIKPSEQEVVNAVRNFSYFQGQNGFDPAKYDEVEKNLLLSMGFTDEQLRELARDQFSLKRIKEIV